MAALIVLAVLVLFVLVLLARTIRVIPQARAGVVERLGRYSRTLTPGMTIVIPFIDRVRPLLDLRELRDRIARDRTNGPEGLDFGRSLVPHAQLPLQLRINR